MYVLKSKTKLNLKKGPSPTFLQLLNEHVVVKTLENPEIMSENLVIE